MKLAVYSTQRYDQKYLEAANKQHFSKHNIELTFHDFPLTSKTVSLARDHDAVCVFVNDTVDADILKSLREGGTRAILLRCTGFDNVDLDAAKDLDMFVARVSAYAPEAVAEFAVALMLTLNRKTHRAYSKVRDGNFNLDGLLGFTMHKKTVGILGTGRIGLCAARILKGFGCRVLGYDNKPNDEFKTLGEYVDLDEFLAESEIISLHCPLLDETRHIINKDTLGKMREGAMLINTSRGALVDAPALIPALKAKRLGAVALDVYEHEGPLFYADHSEEIVQDDTIQRLLTFPNVIVSGHQAFFTKEALTEISETTLQNLVNFEKGGTKDDKNVLVEGKSSS